MVQESIISIWKAQRRGVDIRSPKGFLLRALRFHKGKYARAERLSRENNRPLAAAIDERALEVVDEALIAKLVEAAPPRMRDWLAEVLGSAPASNVSAAARWKRESRVRAWILQHFTRFTP